jgi:hypothetical protein
MKNKTTPDAESYARAYIDAALEAQKCLGRAVKISREDYEGAVGRAATAFGELLQVRERPARLQL